MFLGLSLKYLLHISSFKISNATLISTCGDLLRKDIRQPARDIDAFFTRLLSAKEHLLDADADFLVSSNLAQLGQGCLEVLLAVKGLDLAQDGTELGVRVDAGNCELVVENGLEV